MAFLRFAHLLIKTGKFFEQTLVDRLKAWMAENLELDLSPNQFSFYEDRLTYDTLYKIMSIVKEIVSQRNFVVALSLDIANAFNSLPWRTIRSILDAAILLARIPSVVDCRDEKTYFFEDSGPKRVRFLDAR